MGRSVDLLSLSRSKTSPVSSRGRCMRVRSGGRDGGRMVKEGHRANEIGGLLPNPRALTLFVFLVILGCIVSLDISI